MQNVNQDLTFSDQQMADHENDVQIIDRAELSYIEKGKAVKRINDRESFRLTHKSLADFCLHHWHYKPSYVSYLMAASELAFTIVERGMRPPKNEGQARKLVPLWKATRDVPEMSDAVFAAWQTLLKRQDEGEVLTAEKIEDFIKSLLPKKSTQTREERQAATAKEVAETIRKSNILQFPGATKPVEQPTEESAQPEKSRESELRELVTDIHDEIKLLRDRETDLVNLVTRDKAFLNSWAVSTDLLREDAKFLTDLANRLDKAKTRTKVS
jgi:hypothetical protein